MLSQQIETIPLAKRLDLALDARIEKYLKSKQNSWHDYNIPYADGESLMNLIIENRFKSILEIGTSSGHSTIWLARAAARTGGRVITIEIDRGRYDRARKNFTDAGVGHLIESKFGDAMQIIPTLTQNFDFVFSDATWSTQPAEGYTNFFKLTEPKLTANGLFTMHNVTDGFGDDGRFFRFLEWTGKYTTQIIRTSSAGISVTRRK